MAPLKEIYNYIERSGFTPILAWYFDIPKEKINEYDLRLLHDSRYAIFEVTSPAGHLMELERAAKEYGNLVLIVYNVRDVRDREPPPQVSEMIKTLHRPILFGYTTFRELEHFILRTFTNLKRVKVRDEKIFRSIIENEKKRIHRKALQTLERIFNERDIKNAQNMLNSMYLLLMIDQLPDGSWGRSITDKLREKFSLEKGKGSITATSLAIEGILNYTNNPEHHGIKKAMDFLLEHRKENGSYGPIVPISVYEGKYTIIENCRHTSTATRAVMKVYNKIDPETVKSLKFLLDHQKTDGGWGITSDVSIEDSDAITTAQTLEALFLSVKLGISRFIDPDKFNGKILKGIGWLCEKLEDGFWIYGGIKEYKTYYTSFILERVPELRKYSHDTYEKALQQLIDIFDKQKAIPYYAEGMPHVGATANFLSALNHFHQDYEQMIFAGLKRLIRIYKKTSSLMPFEAPTCSFVLSLSNNKFLMLRLSQEQQKSLDEIVQQVLQNKEKIIRRVIYPYQILPSEYRFLSRVIVEILKLEEL